MAQHRGVVSARSRLLLTVLAAVLIGGPGTFAAVKAVQSLAGGNDPASGAQEPPGSGDPLADCESTPPVTAVASSVVAPLLSRAAVLSCTDLSITVADGRVGVRASEAADLWLTDSTLWAASRREDPGLAVSIASSPIVASLPPDLAEELGGDTFIWASLMEPERTMRLGLHDPAATATGLLTGWPLLRAQRDVSDVPFTALALTANALAQPLVVGAPLLGSPPSGTMLFSGEYAAQPGEQVAIMRGDDAEPFMDFPAYNIATDPLTRVEVEQLIRVLASPELSEARAEARLREADGTARFDTSALGEAQRRIQMPNAGSTIKLYGLGASGSVRGRVLVALDVSAAMAAPQADGAPLIDSVRSTALVAMSALYDHTSVGVWLFGEDVDGEADHTELVPIVSLGSGRERIQTAVQDIRLSPGTGSSLYPTVLEGYRELQDGFDPGAAQSLVILTAGQGGVRQRAELTRLLDDLDREADPDQRIRVMGVGFGPDADVSGLRRVSEQMGGVSVRVEGPVQMLGVFITMVGQVAAQG